jgi:IS1 family transposase
MTKTKENVYIMTAVTRRPRRIVGFVVAASRTLEEIQGIIDSSPQAEFYYTDGFTMYKDLCYWGTHIVAPLKSETYTVEGMNADIRHYIAGLARRMRTFFRSLDTLTAVMKLFVNAYNKFGIMKAKYQKLAVHRPTSKSRLHKYADTPFALCDFF